MTETKVALAFPNSADDRFALVSIDFSGNNIEARGAEAIGKAVSVMPSLTEVR